MVDESRIKEFIEREIRSAYSGKLKFKIKIEDGKINDDTSEVDNWSIRDHMGYVDRQQPSARFATGNNVGMVREYAECILNHIDDLGLDWNTMDEKDKIIKKNFCALEIIRKRVLQPS